MRLTLLLEGAVVGWPATGGALGDARPFERARERMSLAAEGEALAAWGDLAALETLAPETPALGPRLAWLAIDPMRVEIGDAGGIPLCGSDRAGRMAA